MPKPRDLRKNGDFSITATLDARALTASLERLQRESGKDMKKLVKESARRLGVDLAIRTFPKSFGNGIGAIAKDVSQIYPSRRFIKRTLDGRQKDAGRIFLSIFKRNPQQALAYASKIGVKIDLVKAVDKSIVKGSVGFRKSASGGRSQRAIKMPGTIQMLDDRDGAIEKYSRRMGKRVGTVAGGWFEASKAFGAARYDGNDANLEKFKRARRPMIVGRGELKTSGARSVATLTNLVDYSDACIPSGSMAFAVRREVVNLEKQADAVINRRAGKEIARVNA